MIQVLFCENDLIELDERLFQQFQMFILGWKDLRCERTSFQGRRHLLVELLLFFIYFERCDSTKVQEL